MRNKLKDKFCDPQTNTNTNINSNLGCYALLFYTFLPIKIQDGIQGKKLGLMPSTTIYLLLAVHYNDIGIC